MGQLKATIDFKFRRYFNTNSAVKRKCVLRSIGTIMIVGIDQFNSTCRKRGRVTLIIDLLDLIASLFFNPLGKRFYFTVCLKRYTIRYDIILQVSEVFESKKVIA